VSEEEEEFQGVVTACLNVLLLGIETRLDGGLQAMVRVNWSAVEAVRGPTLSPADIPRPDCSFRSDLSRHARH